MAMVFDNVRMYEPLTLDRLPALFRETADFIEHVGLARGENIDERGRHCLMAALNACARRMVWYHSADIAVPLARWLATHRRDEMLEAFDISLDSRRHIVDQLGRHDGTLDFGHALMACQHWNDAMRADEPVRSQEQVVATLREAADDMSPSDGQPTIF